MYYGAYNTHADLDRHNHGFSNTWSVVRFGTKADRDDFLEAFANKKAKACTRQEAGWIYKDNYLAVGKEVPEGGLFNGNTFWGQGFMGVEWEDIDPAALRVTDAAHRAYRIEVDQRDRIERDIMIEESGSYQNAA